MSSDLPRAPLSIASLDELLRRHAEAFRDKEAVVAVDPDSSTMRRISYRELDTLVRKTAAFLNNQGIQPGDHFAVLMHNVPEVLIFELAGALIGATTVPLDFKRDTLERKFFKLKDTEAKALFIRDEDGLAAKEKVTIERSCPQLHVHVWSSFDEFEALLPTKPIEKKQLNHDLTTHYLVLYTSGTTALPKGILLTTRACLLNAAGIVAWQKFTEKDRFNIVLPLHHINSTEFCLAMLLIGGTIILNSRYSTSKFWHIITKHQATNSSIVPTILHDLLVRHAEFQQANLDISSLKRICIGSAPVLPEETLRFYKTFGVRVVQGYGQTETALRVAGVPIDTDEERYKNLVKLNTIGTELANNHLAIMDGNNNDLPEGKEGEICISGPILADGYLNNPQETAQAFKKGWFHSGDLGYWKDMNGEKYFFIIGRIKEIIIKGGVNLSPAAIEDVLLKAFPEIDGVSVVGYPDSRMGEEIAVVVVLKRSHLARQGETLQNQIIESGQNGVIPGLSRYEAPKKVFVFDSLPKTSTGKIQRVEVKKMVADTINKEKEQKHYYVRRITPSETRILKEAVAINNDRWHGLPSTLEEFTARAKNGILWGAFEEKEGLVGSLSCIQLPFSVVDRLKTWDEASARGTLANHDPKGDIFLCVAISVRSSSNNVTMKQYNNVRDEQLKLLAKKHIKEYVNSDRDHVLSFHRKPKGGIAGATVLRILENGRPDDTEAMGYNILMRYPTIAEGTTVIRSNAPSPSILLIEHALLYAKKKGLKEVIAFSRPAGFRSYLSKLSS